jgi:branched-chain amino acid transport system substrate-binding protein
MLVAALAAVAMLVLSACGGTSSSDKTKTATSGGQTPAASNTSAAGGGTITIKKGDPIKIGISTTLSTDNAQLGIPIRDSALMTIKDKGTIKGFTIEGDPQDDLCSGPGSVTAAQKLVADKVVAVMGAMCSSGTVAALDTYAAQNLLVISSSSTAVPVTQQGKKNFFRTAWNDATQGGEMAKYALTKLNKKNAVLVNDQSVYGKGLMDVFNKSFTDGGGKVTSQEAVTVGEKDFSPVVTKIKGESPDIVVFGGFIAEGAVLVRQLKDAGVNATFMGADGIADQKFIDQAGGAAEGAYVSRGPTPTDTTVYDKFAKEYESTYNKQQVDQFADYTYDAVNIILTAIDKVATVDSSGNLVIDRQKLIDAVRTSTTSGASGNIEFNDVGDRKVVGVVNRIDQVTNEKLTRIQ